MNVARATKNLPAKWLAKAVKRHFAKVRIVFLPLSAFFKQWLTTFLDPCRVKLLFVYR